MKRRILKTLAHAVVIVALATFLSYDLWGQNAVPVFPPQVGGVNIPQGVINGCSGTGTLANGILTLTNACMINGGFTLCQAWPNAASLSTGGYSAIGVGCVPTTTATATTTATSSATTAAYGGTSIATSVPTATLTSTAIGGVSLTASTLNASPVVVWEGIR